jgi:hypothetical protein
LQKLPFLVTWHQLSVLPPQLHPKYNSMCNTKGKHSRGLDIINVTDRITMAYCKVG